MARALYALIASGLVEDAEGESPLGAAIPEADARTFSVALPEPPAAAPPTPDFEEISLPADRAAFATPVPPPVESDARADLLRLYEALPRATHYAVLGLRPDATFGDVATAYARLSEDQDRRWKGLENDPRLSSAMFTLKLRRREAFEA